MKKIVIILLSFLILPVTLISIDYHDNLTLDQKMTANEALIDEISNNQLMGPVSVVSSISESIIKWFDTNVSFQYEQALYDNDNMIELDIFMTTYPDVNYYFEIGDDDYRINMQVYNSSFPDIWETSQQFYVVGRRDETTMAPNTFIDSDFQTSFWYETLWQTYGDHYKQRNLNFVQLYLDAIIGRSVFDVLTYLPVGFVHSGKVISRPVTINSSDDDWLFYYRDDNAPPPNIDVVYVQYGVKLYVLMPG